MESIVHSCCQCAKEIKPGKSYYLCSDCGKEKFCSKKCLNKHREFDHPDIYTCSKCHKSLINILTNKTQYVQCPDCDNGEIYCKRGKCLEDHRRQFHYKDYFCQSCGNYLTSLFSKTIKFQTCELCGKSLGKFCSNKKCIEQHYRKEHPGERICAECNKFIHGKSFHCTECGKGIGKFCSQDCFNTHLKKSHAADYVCTQCGGFIKKNSFSCGICGESAGKYCSKKCLIPHKRDQHYDEYFCAYCQNYIKGEMHYNDTEAKLEGRKFCCDEHLTLYFNML